ncbi:MAG TPA: M20 family metallopeptidase [Roseimicrobium sp.]|nr:M20 family metallopeptidase [Roseimicrobium sp.]
MATPTSTHPDDLTVLDRLIRTTQDLVAIPGTERRPEDLAACLAYCRRHLESVPDIEIREYSSRGFTSMVALPKGIDVVDILAVGHLDVIQHPGEQPCHSEVRDGRIWGPGAGDMKGQCAIMLELFTGLHRSYPGISFGIALTSDEERGGEDGVKFLFETVGLRCGMAIVPDGGSIDAVTVEEKGILQLRLKTRGTEGHAAAPWLTPNALVILTKAVAALCASFDRLADASPDHWYPTCVPTMFETANRTVNCIPAAAEAVVDIRFPPPHTPASMLSMVQRIVGSDVVVETIASCASTVLSPDPLYLQIAAQQTGRSIRQVRASGGSDALFIVQHGIPVVLSSPLVGNLHREDEWIDITSMETFHRICEQFILRKLGRVIPG